MGGAKQKLNSICALELGDCCNHFHRFGLFVELYSYILCLCYSYLWQLIVYFLTVCLIEQEKSPFQKLFVNCRPFFANYLLKHQVLILKLIFLSKSLVFLNLISLYLIH